MSRTFWYGLIALAVVVALGATGFWIHMAKKSQREQALLSELVQLRSAIAIYKSSFQENPPTLEEALGAKYAFQIPAWTVKQDPALGAVDPFGNRYQYSAKTGWVHSDTSGYEKW